MESVRFAEFFAGIGLMRAALEPLGWRCAFANDIDPDKAETYRANFGDDDLLVDDIQHLSAKKLPSDLTLITACFPCVDLSLAGNRAGLKGQDSGTFWEFRRILKDLRDEDRVTPLLLIENVQGFLNSNGGEDIENAVRSLNELGYRCDIVLIDAKHFTPQSRPRLFIIGEHDTSVHGVLRPLGELEASAAVRPSAVEGFIASHPRLRWGRVDFPPLPERKQRVSEILEQVHHSSPLWWSDERVRKLLDSMRPLHRARVEALLNSNRGGVGTVYRRTRSTGSTAEVRTDGLAGCLRTPRGGSSKQFLIVARNGKVRVRNMTPREYARLQGVPDSFGIGDDVNKALFGFGDAVCVPAVRWLAEIAFYKVHSRRWAKRPLSNADIVSTSRPSHA